MKYEYIPFLDRYTDDDNMVRQAGALYGLGEVLARMENDTFDLESTIENSINYFENNTHTGNYKMIDFKCVLKEDECSLGATALALVGILDFVEYSPENAHKYSELIEGYKDFLIAMNLNSGGYQNAYNPEGDQNKAESSFSNGEAFLALVRYYKYQPDDELKKMLDKSFGYFAEVYGPGKWDPNFYLWGMAALKDLYKLDPDPKYYDYVKEYSDWRVNGRQNSRFTSHNYCAYIEGVVSAYSVLEGSLSEKDDAYYKEEISFWLAKSAELQVELKDVMRISVTGGPMYWLPLKNTRKSLGGFLTGYNEPVQRIDFTQHCMSSYLQTHVDLNGNKL